MLVAYVAGPYRDPDPCQVTRNVQAARYVAMELWRLGYAVLCPVANSAWMDVDGGIDNDTFLRGDLEMLMRCDLLVVQGDWERSAGTLAEIAAARDAGMPVFFWPADRARILLGEIANESQRLGLYE